MGPELKMPAVLSNKPYRIGRSCTGLGRFATKPIKRGAKIVRYFGPLLDRKKKRATIKKNKYLFHLSDRWTIDGSVRENIARYINHACEPNAKADVINFHYGSGYFHTYLGRSANATTANGAASAATT